MSFSVFTKCTNNTPITLVVYLFIVAVSALCRLHPNMEQIVIRIFI